MSSLKSSEEILDETYAEYYKNSGLKTILPEKFPEAYRNIALLALEKLRSQQLGERLKYLKTLEERNK